MRNKSKTQMVRDVLSKTNLKKDHNDPEKEEFVSDRDLASQLGVSKNTVWRVRRDLLNRGGADDTYVLYAWRWSGDHRYAKIGISTMANLNDRLASTYHPTDDIELIGYVSFSTREEAKEHEQYILNEALNRTRPDREWVSIDEDFNEMVDQTFSRSSRLPTL